MHGPEIVVSGRLFSPAADPVIAPVVLRGEDLVRAARPQLGEMLASLPGVSSSAFAPGVSRPVLRGFDGPRVAVLLDGIGSLDASSVSADHGVALDTLNVERVDVLHGPQALVYAGDPMGGVVNAVDKRIPRQIPAHPATFDALASFGTAASALEAGAAANLRLADHLVAHVDAAYNHAGDQAIGGYALAPGLRADTLQGAAARLAAGDAAGAALLSAAASQRGTLPNSGAHGYTLGAGIAYLAGAGEMGVSVQRLSSDYGIPPRPAPQPAEPVSIALRQTRLGLRAGLDLGGMVKHVEFTAAYGDYRHQELDGAIPVTTFLNRAFDARLVATQGDRGGWRGQTGVQYGAGNLDLVGDALLPDTVSSRFAAFTLQQLRLTGLDLEAALRFEHNAVRAKPALAGRGFAQLSGAIGAAWHVSPNVMLNLAAIHGERAPSGEELFINGAHDATQSFEIGNPGFTIERSNGVEGGVRYHGSRAQLALTAYATNFAHFITPVPTGAVQQGLPVYQFIQAPARYRGLEAEGAFTLAQWGGPRALKLEGGGDYVHATLPGIGPVPRIPPLRLRGALELSSPRLTLRGEAEWNDRQDRIAANEYPVAAFTLLNASAIWRPFGVDGALSLILAANNLLDADARRAASETRDFVPLAGRDIRLTAAFRL